MPVINVKLPGPLFPHEVKQRLIPALTDAFVGVLGEAARPFTFVIVEEAQLHEFGVAGRPMPDPQWLFGDEYQGIYEKGKQSMNDWLVQQTADQGRGSSGS
jgi:4-oxalocrotonate tautomerase